MIRTFRDTENEIKALKVEIEYLKKQVRIANGSNSKNEEQPEAQPEIRVVEIDSDLSAGGSQVHHQLYHIFTKIKADVLDVITLTAQTIIANLATLKEIITTKLTINDPTYLRGWTIENKSDHPEAGSNERGIKFKDPLAREVLGLYNNHPNFPGAALAHIFPNGHIIPAQANAFYLGHPNFRWLNIETQNLVAYDSIKANIGGTNYDGWSGTEFPLTDVFLQTMTLQYKDWAGTNQSANVGIAIGKTIHPGQVFRMGLRS